MVIIFYMNWRKRTIKVLLLAILFSGVLSLPTTEIEKFAENAACTLGNHVPELL